MNAELGDVQRPEPACGCAPGAPVIRLKGAVATCCNDKHNKHNK